MPSSYSSSTRDVDFEPMKSFTCKEYDDEVYAVGFALFSELWDSEHNPNKMVAPIDQSEDYVGLLYHLCPKTDSSVFVAGNGVYNQSKLAPAVGSPSKGFFNDLFEVKMHFS